MHVIVSLNSKWYLTYEFLFKYMETDGRKNLILDPCSQC